MDRMPLWDCHMHSSFSADSPAPMEEMIEAAVRKGLSGICFTEHLDPDYPPGPENLDFSLDIPSYQSRLKNLQEVYCGRIRILYGIELGLQPHLTDAFQKLAQTEPFDFIIGSSHVVHGADPYYPDFYRGRREEDCYEEYFVSILENLEAFRDIDAYGHLDYVVRYGPNKNKHYSYKAYQDILDAILGRLIQFSIALEVNTGGFAYGLGQPNPCREIIARYKELGGELITLGADAHVPERIAYSFPQAKDLLEECGFRYYTVFHGRKPEFLPL